MTDKTPKSPVLALEERIETHIRLSQCKEPNSPEKRHEEMMVGILCEKYKELAGKPYVAKYQEGASA